MGPNWRMSIIMQDKLISYQLICHITLSDFARTLRHRLKSE